MFRLLARLIVLILVYAVVRSALSAILGFFKENSPRQAAGPQRASGPVQAGGALMKDPVCGTYVSADTGFTLNCKGEVIHFCSADCRDRYSTTVRS